MKSANFAFACLCAALVTLTWSCSPPGLDAADDGAIAAPARAVAASVEGGYLGMSLAASTVLFPASPWTTPIGAGPAISADSPSEIAALRYALVTVLGRKPALQINMVKNSAPIHVVDRATSPILDVPSDSALPVCLDPDQDRVAESIPIPDSVWADPSDDSHMIIVDQTSMIAYEFWNWRKEGTRLYRAGMMGKWNLAGKGWNTVGSDLYRTRNGATASRAPYIGGLVRYEEVVAGEIRHALHMVVPTTRALQFQTPAVATDGRNSGSKFIPEGARIQLNPALNLDTLGLSRPSKVVARALQVYGAYVTDTASGWAIKLQNLGADGGAWSLLGAQINLDRIPVEQYRVLK